MRWRCQNKGCWHQCEVPTISKIVCFARRRLDRLRSGHTTHNRLRLPAPRIVGLEEIEVADVALGANSPSNAPIPRQVCRVVARFRFGPSSTKVRAQNRGDKNPTSATGAVVPCHRNLPAPRLWPPR
jgi:hypothetical protein